MKLVFIGTFVHEIDPIRFQTGVPFYGCTFQHYRLSQNVGNRISFTNKIKNYKQHGIRFDLVTFIFYLSFQLKQKNLKKLSFKNCRINLFSRKR